MRTNRSTLSRLLLLCSLFGCSGLALAQDVPATPPPDPVAVPAAPRVIPISQAAFLLQAVRFEGHPELLNDAQRTGLAQAVADGFPAALARKYPQAHVALPDDVDAVQLTPVVVVPPSLSPFENVVFRLDLALPQGEIRSFEGHFSLLNLWLAQAGALQVAWDGTLAGLPAQ